MSRRLIAPLVLAALLLASCGGASELRWRDLRLTAPDGWVVHEDEATRFALTDAPLGTEEEPGDGEAGVFMTYEPGASAQAWRDLIEQEGWVLEEEETLTFGASPATRLVFSHGEDAEVPLREMVVVVPSRSIVMLFQPIVLRTRSDGPAIFDAHRADFEAILASVRLGAPVE